MNKKKECKHEIGQSLTCIKEGYEICYEIQKTIPTENNKLLETHKKYCPVCSKKTDIHGNNINCEEGKEVISFHLKRR